MKKESLLVIALLTLLSFGGNAQTTQPKGKLFIIGGGKRSGALIDRMITEAGLSKTDYVAILPLASEEPDSAYYFAKQQFEKAGLKTVNFNFTAVKSLSNIAVDSIAKAKLIYLPGGDQIRFMSLLSGTQIKEAITEAYFNGSMVAGTSAGAAVMSKEMITGNELLHTDYESTAQSIEGENIEIKEGLGLLPMAIIDQHFLIRSRHNRLLSVVVEYPAKKAIGIDESTAILVKNGWAEVVGDSQVLVYKNPTKSKSLQNHKLGARGILLDIYLPGEKFAL
ncbi:cyanophycinase [Solitalea sp. MAHUQ-68]|uniref:Cyanophycinase n=1 Tax=Solitalea agri TaxID=2953739 RepID=A0A9X2JDH1_9SPHI|nr:cyanophycinase [Solitalea agri]MCO4294143.1 cyanophycinase [Solitalea agri]